MPDALPDLPLCAHCLCACGADVLDRDGLCPTCAADLDLHDCPLCRSRHERDRPCPQWSREPGALPTRDLVEVAAILTAGAFAGLAVAVLVFLVW